MESSNGCDKSHLNSLVKNIVKILLSTSKYFHCPFCADEYLFEFTLRHHLLKNHEEDLSKIVQSPDSSIKFCDSNICPYCGALFYYISALPKHIINSHSRDCLVKWQAIEKENSLQKRFAAEPSIKCVPCSPGLSDLFDELNAGDSTNGGGSSKKKHRSHRRKSSPLYKSALKNANRMKQQQPPRSADGSSWVSCDFEFTAGTAATVNSRRSTSARRELLFDEPCAGTAGEDANISSVKKPKRSAAARKRFSLKGLKPRIGLRKFVLSKFSKKYHCKIVTSTPNNFLDDDDNGSNAFDSRAQHNQERWNRIHFD